jgi:hypothetical protein
MFDATGATVDSGPNAKVIIVVTENNKTTNRFFLAYTYTYSN